MVDSRLVPLWCSTGGFHDADGGCSYSVVLHVVLDTAAVVRWFDHRGAERYFCTAGQGQRLRVVTTATRLTG